MSSNQLTAVSATPTAAAETVIATTAPYAYDFPNPFLGGEHSGTGNGVCISGCLSLNNVGTGTTAIVLRVRQSSITGPIVQNSIAKPVTATTADSIAWSVVDTSRAAAQSGGVVYVVTLASTGLTGAGNVQSGAVVVEGM